MHALTSLKKTCFQRFRFQVIIILTFLFCRVEALAFVSVFAECKLLGILLYATVIFVPLAATVVVASVTKTIALPIWVTARAKTHLLLWCEIFVFGIQTLADFAELSLIVFARVAATITFVPSTPTIVIVVVADAIVRPTR
jgi:hypothetical protein